MSQTFLHGVLRRFGFFLAIAATALCAANNAFAQSGIWMILGDGGKLDSGNRPQRIARYANADRVFDRTDASAKATEIVKGGHPKTLEARLRALEVKEMDVVEIYEQPQAPGLKNLVMQFTCGDMTTRVVRSESIERNNVHRFGGATPWEKAPANSWQRAAHFLACQRDLWAPMVKADQAEFARTGRVPEQSVSQFGISMVGNWSGYNSQMNVYQFTWDKLWAGTATPVPFHHNRTAAEEQEYQQWKQRNDTVLAENAIAAPKVDAMIASVQTTLKGMDEEKAFTDQIAKNFAEYRRRGGEREWIGLQGQTLEEILDIWGQPDAVTTQGNSKNLLYAIDQIVRTSKPEVDHNGTVIRFNMSENRYSCRMNLTFRVGGNRPEYRFYDYVVTDNQNRLIDGLHCTRDVMNSRLRNRQNR